MSIQWKVIRGGGGGGGGGYGPVRRGGLAVYFAIVDCGFLSRAAAWLFLFYFYF